MTVDRDKLQKLTQQDGMIGQRRGVLLVWSGQAKPLTFNLELKDGGDDQAPLGDEKTETKTHLKVSVSSVMDL